MSTQELISTLLAICIAGLSWFLVTLWNSVKALGEADKETTKNIQKLEVLMAGKYIPREEFEQKLNSVFEKLDRTYEKLDGIYEKFEKIYEKLSEKVDK